MRKSKLGKAAEKIGSQISINIILIAKKIIAYITAFGPEKASTAETGIEHYVTNDYTVKTGWGQYLDSDGPKKTAIIAGIATVAAIAAATTIHIMRKRNEAAIAGMKASIESEKDPEKKKELEHNYENLMKSMYNEKGKIRIDPDFSDVPDKNFQKNFSKIMQDKNLRKTGKEYIKKNGSDFLEFDREHAASKEQPKEQVAKAKDGSEIHARRKKTGHGMTYVRTRNGKEIGYATKSEFRAAHKNESYMGLSDYINESIIGRKETSSIWPNPYHLTIKDAIGKMTGMPVEIITLALYTARKGLRENYSIEELQTRGLDGSFIWSDTLEGYYFWRNMCDKKFDIFYKTYTPESLRKRLEK